MTRHHPSTIASPNTILPSFGNGAATFYGHDVNALINTEHRLRKIGLTFETSHELFDRLDYQRINGGDIIYTDDGPRLDDENETLFLIGREVKS